MNHKDNNERTCLQDVVNIIKQVLREAKEEGMRSIGKTRLVKLIYLVEVEFYRIYQKRLTNLEWKFFHFGPYPLEIQEILGSLEFEKEEIDLASGKVFFKYSMSFDEPVESYVSSDVGRLVTNIVKEWGDANLNRLLDYVYFETEPMVDAKRGYILDFSKILLWKETKIKKIHLEPKRLIEIRRRIEKHVSKLSRPKEGIKFNADLTRCLHIWDEGRFQVLIKGKCTIDTRGFKNQKIN